MMTDYYSFKTIFFSCCCYLLKIGLPTIELLGKCFSVTNRLEPITSRLSAIR